MKMRVTRSMDKDTLKNTPSAMVTWQMSKSHVTDATEESIAVELNTPRILELDVNRVMIGQADVRYSRWLGVRTNRVDSESQWKDSFGG